MNVDLLIRKVIPAGAPAPVSIGIKGSSICFVGTDTESLNPAMVIEGDRLLMLPGLVETHAHLDKSYTVQAAAKIESSETDSALRVAIERMRSIRAQSTPAGFEARARAAITRAISKGVCCLRSHIDVSTEQDLASIDILLGLRETYADRIRLEFTVLTNLEDDRLLQLASLALDKGMDAIGGAPALSNQPELAIDRAFSLAEQFQCAIDLHIDETEDPASPCLEYLADQVIERCWSLPVMASHCCALAFKSEADQARIIDKLARSGIHIVTLPACNLGLMGRNISPKPRGAVPVVPLLKAGVNVCAGTDNVRDPFQPWGDYDPLLTAAINAQVAQLDDVQEALAMVSNRAARALNLAGHGLNEGCTASFSLVQADNILQAISESPLRQLVFYQGKLILSQTVQQYWSRPEADTLSPAFMQGYRT